MPHVLEYPGAEGIPDWDSLYRARADEVTPHRPVFTGDIFEKVPVQGLGESKTKTVMILQHPCALRSNGVDLHSRLMVAELRNHRIIPVDQWSGHLAKMPLPGLIPTLESARRDQAAFFDELYLVSSDELALEKRIAVLSQAGVNLLLQRWVHHNSRVVVPTATYQEMTSPSYEEADLVEEWCEERAAAGVGVRDASVEAMKWLREDSGTGVTRQRLLNEPQCRSAVRRQLRRALQELAS